MVMLLSSIFLILNLLQKLLEITTFFLKIKFDSSVSYYFKLKKFSNFYTGSKSTCYMSQFLTPLP